LANSGQLADQWRRESEIWFDGSVGSVDRRLAACDRLLASSKGAVARDGVGPGTRRHLAAIEDLETQRGALEGLRRNLLTAAGDLEDPTDWGAPLGGDRIHEMHQNIQDWQHPVASRHNLASQDQRWVDLESTRFFCANSDCTPEELVIRAQNHSELKTSTYTQTRSRAITAEFVNKVASLKQAAPRPKVASVPPLFQDLEDEVMFM
jgi:hypothetical protein